MCALLVSICVCMHTCVCWRGASRREELVTLYYRSHESPSFIPASHTALQENFSWEFLGVPVIRTQCFHQECPDSVSPGGETKLPQTVWHGKKYKERNLFVPLPQHCSFPRAFYCGQYHLVLRELERGRKQWGQASFSQPSYPVSSRNSVFVQFLSLHLTLYPGLSMAGFSGIHYTI